MVLAIRWQYFTLALSESLSQKCDKPKTSIKQPPRSDGLSYNSLQNDEFVADLWKSYL